MTCDSHPLLIVAVCLVRAFEHFQESYVVFAEKTQVLDLILEVSDTLNAHSECVARVFLAVNTTELKHVGVYHTTTKNLYPACVLAKRTSLATAYVAADVHLGTWLSEREV